MTAIPTDLAAHFENDCTTLCHCWLLERGDGQRLGFTDHDRALVVDGQLYEPDSGFAQSEARASLGMGVDSVDVEGALTSDVLSEEDIAAGRLDGATVRTLLVNWADPGQNAQIRAAVIGKITRADGGFLAELESITAYLDRPSGRHLRRTCDARLGDQRCGASLAASALNGAGAIIGMTAPFTLSVTGLGSFAPDWFSHGMLTWATGTLAGVEEMVLEHRVAEEGVLLRLSGASPLPETGNTFTVVAGCDKRFATCKAKFGNAVNFRGFPHLPGNDAAYGYVTGTAVHDGRALVR